MTAKTILKYTVDLNKGLQMTPLAPMLATEDDNAHSFVVSAVRDGEKVSFADAQVRGYFIRPDQVTVPLDGEVDGEGNALVTLKEACYRVQGKFQIAIRVISDDVKAVVFCGDGSLRKVNTDAFIDEEGIIPSLDELLAQIATIEGAVNNANTAATRANEAAEKAENAKGDTGATPNLTIGTVETLAPGSSATATITGTPEDPVLNLGLPRGTDGTGAVRTVNGQAGDVVLTASDVGALPDTYEAPVSSINGKTGEVSLDSSDVGAAPAVEDTNYPGCYYRMVNGEKEWINPPLVLGEEYRTAERWDGNAVYVKNIDLGRSADQKEVAYNVSFKARLLSIEVMIGTFPASQRPAGASATGSGYYCEFYVTGANVKLFVGTSMVNVASYAKIRFTKEGK